MNWPQWTVLILFALQVVATGNMHGQRRTDEWNVGSALVNVLIFGWLLWMGGFFSG